MTKQFIKTILILLPFISSSQNSQNSDHLYDTVQIYKCTLSTVRSGDSIYYKINGKLVTKEEHEKINKGFKEEKKCNPCMLKTLNLDSSLDSQGLFYYTCPGANEKTEFETNTKESAKIFININSCKDGEWLFYAKDGNLKEIKYFDHGTEVKTKGKLFQ